MSAPAPPFDPTMLKPLLAAESSPSPSPPSVAEGKGDEKRSSDTPLSSDQTLASESLAPSKPHVTQLKKWALLAVFSLAFFIDCWMAAAVLVFVDPLTRDLSVADEQKSWVITAYSVSFAAFLLFWGRMSDIYSAKLVFCYGFVGLGLINLVSSFFTDKFSFFTFRALQGVAAASVIPASYRLIVMLFDADELPKALALYGMTGGLGACTGNIGGGVIGLIPATGQMASWRWFFRIMAIMILPIAIGSFFWIPRPQPRAGPTTNNLRRLDLVGSLSMLVGLVLLILGLTLGATVGWRTVDFLVPFLLSFPVIVFFFVWEAKIPFEFAVLPPSVWRIPNFTIFFIFALYLYSWVSLPCLALIETFIGVNGDSPIVAAAKIAPIGIAATAMSIFLSVYPRFVARPRVAIIIGMTAVITAAVLFLLSDGAKGSDYWKFVFPGAVIGGAGIVTTQIATNVGIMSAVPPEMAGVAGAMLQVALQAGQVVALSVQAGILTIRPGNFTNRVSVRAQYIFLVAWGVVWLVGFLVFYRPGSKAEKEGKEAEQP